MFLRMQLSNGMLFTLLISTFFATAALAGSPCPPREDIYPCSCASVSQGKNLVHTILSCHKLPDTDALDYIFPTLRSVQIDQFYLYDSFWEGKKLGGQEGDKKRMLPTDWLTRLRIKELEIVDTPLSSCFACNSKQACRNGVTQRFTAVNSSESEKICTLCDTGRGDKYSWIACMSKLKHFHFSHGRLTSLRTDFFPTRMDQLLVVNLTHNQLVKIDPNAFRNLPRLMSLDLSHNALESLDQIFGDQKMNLEFLDVSWNMLKTLGPDLFPSVPYLKTLKADNNHIVNMSQNYWKKVPDSLRNIDLRENPLHCDCSILWINSTFHINVVLQGRCASPEDYENTLLRRASRLLSDRCDEEGNIGSRGPKQKLKATDPSVWK